MLKNWSMIYLFGLPDGSNMASRWGRVVTGEVVMDGKQQLLPGARLCTSPVLRSPGNAVHTRTGEVYSLVGEGETFELPVTQLPRLKALENPTDIATELGDCWRQPGEQR